MNILWNIIAKIVSRPKIAKYLIQRSQSHVYFHLDGYMNRWWVWNAYDDTDYTAKSGKNFPWLPSFRIHQILRKDGDRHHHDHPWNARTIILKGWYKEDRLRFSADIIDGADTSGDHVIESFDRHAGDTATLKFGEFHNITEISEGGVWTLFISYKWQGVWGFWVDGKKMSHLDYFKLYPSIS